jgi:hypothetical protein
MKQKNNLKAFLDDLLKEDNPAPPPASAADIAPVETPKDLSMDQVIDRYFIRYEKESIPNAGDYEKEMASQAPLVQKQQPAVAPQIQQNLESANSRIPHYGQVVAEALRVITEADDEEDPGLDVAGGGGGDEDTSKEEPSPSSPAGNDQNQPVINTPQINLNNFAASIARLVNNFNELMNPKDIILNRVESYITTNYDPRTAKELMDILDTNFSLRTQNAQDHREVETTMATPYAQGALSKE